MQRWHSLVAANDLTALSDLLDDDATFESPVVFKPQRGRALTAMYLYAAASLLSNETFRYVNTWYAERSAVLEFECVLDGITINGVDMIFWNDAERITRFKVMVRPMKAMNALHAAMARLVGAKT